jgi:hypothetical protein
MGNFTLFGMVEVMCEVRAARGIRLQRCQHCPAGLFQLQQDMLGCVQEKFAAKSSCGWYVICSTLLLLRL